MKPIKIVYFKRNEKVIKKPLFTEKQIEGNIKNFEKNNIDYIIEDYVEFVETKVIDKLEEIEKLGVEVDE